MNQETPYAGLTPDVVLDAVEALDLCCDGRLLTLNSYENRVYRVGIEGRRPVVVKFYRPGRWTDAQIQEEHDFTFELLDGELAVAAPLRVADRSLHGHQGFRYALFDSVGGRAPEAGDRDTLRLLGRSLGRLHAVGAAGRFQHRPQLDIERYGQEPVAYLIAHDWLPAHLVEPFQVLSERLLSTLRSIWDPLQDIAALRLHGDCHPGNLLQLDDQIVLVDLDDAITGPAIQDLWMLVSGSGDELRAQVGWLLEGYTLFRDFDVRELALIEPLRCLRLLHYHGWIARRWHDPAFPAAFPWFAENRHWESLIGQMHEQLAELQQDSVRM